MTDDSDDSVTQFNERLLNRKICGLERKIQALSSSRKSKVRADIHNALHGDNPIGTDHYQSTDSHQPRTASSGGSGGEKNHNGGDQPPNFEGGKKGGIPVSERKSRKENGSVAVSAEGLAKADPERTRATMGKESHWKLL